MTSRDETWLRWPSAALAVVVNGWLLHHLWDRVATRPISSPDAGWHLAAGRVITETGGVPRVDPFTFTAGAADWINLNWLAQAILYQLYLLGGPLAVTTLATALFAGAAWAVLQTLRVRRVDPLPGLLVFAAVVFALLYNQGIRPRLWTYALLAVFAWILTVPDPSQAAGDTSDEAPRALELDLGRTATLLGLLWVWNHLHGGFVYGYALLGMDAFAALVASVRGGHGWFPQRTIRLGGVIVLGLAAFAAHPHGFASLPYVASYKQALGSQLTTILELLPLDFTKPHGRFAELYLGLLGLGLWLSPRRPQLRDVLIALPFLHLALTVRRGLFPLVLLTAPMTAALWTAALHAAPAGWQRARAGVTALLEPSWRALPHALLLGTLLWCGARVPGYLQPGVPGDLSGPGWSASLPVRPVRYVVAERLPGRIFNIYRAGGLLGWALYPEQRIYVDGRGDLHARTGAFGNYNALRELAVGWEDLWVAADCELVLDHASSALLRILLERGWTVLYHDDGFGVLRRPAEGGPSAEHGAPPAEHDPPPIDAR